MGNGIINDVWGQYKLKIDAPWELDTEITFVWDNIFWFVFASAMASKLATSFCQPIGVRNLIRFFEAGTAHNDLDEAYICFPFLLQRRQNTRPPRPTSGRIR